MPTFYSHTYKVCQRRGAHEDGVYHASRVGVFSRVLGFCMRGRWHPGLLLVKKEYLLEKNACSRA